MTALLRARTTMLGVVLFCGLSACRQQVPHYSDALMVYPEATQVHWAKFNGTDQLIYQIKVDYPADEVIFWVSDQLKTKGWQARDEDYWNPGQPTSKVRGWTQFADATVQPQATVDAWVGQWENGSGDIAEYVLRYQYPPGDRYTLTVMAVLTPADLAKKAPKMPRRQEQTENNDETAAASFVGCYALKLGKWLPWSVGGDDKFATPPSRIRLLTERGTKGFEKDHLLIRAMEGTVPGRRGPSYWQVKSREQIDLIWNDGLTGVTVELSREGKELRGWAHPHSDAPTIIERIAQVTAQRIACANK